MTDPEMADITYIEPLTVAFAEKIIRKEKPCAFYQQSVDKCFSTWQ